MEVAAAEEPAVYEEELVSGGLFRRLRTAYESADVSYGTVRRHVYHVVCESAAEQVGDPVFQGFLLLEHENLPAVVGQGEGGVRPRHRDSREFLDYVSELHVVALEELPSGRGVEEQVAHGEVGTDGNSDAGGLRLRGASGPYLYSRLVAFPAGAEGHFRYCGYAGEGFSAETVAEYALEVFRRGDLGCGVPFEAQHGVGRTHSAAVVYDLYQRAPRVGDVDRDMGCPCIDGILQQLLYDRRRSLNDLSGRNHVGNLRRKYLEPAHFPLTAKRRTSR